MWFACGQSKKINMHITFVKKIKTDGTPCRKCAEVQARLEKDNYIQKIDEIVIADESNKNSMEVIVEILTIEQPTMDVDLNINNQLFTVNFASDNNFNCLINPSLTISIILSSVAVNSCLSVFNTSIFPP